MSSWLHVKGNILIDSIKPEFDNLSWDDLVGKAWTYEQIHCGWFDDNEQYDVDVEYELEHYPERFMPSGSEGSLSKDITDTADGTIIAIEGHLRDCYAEDADNIEAWFRKVCNKFNIKDAYLEISLDYAFREDILLQVHYK